MSDNNFNALVLFTAPGCVHCEAMKKILSKLKEEGTLDEIIVIDVSQNPEAARIARVRSVPRLDAGGVSFHGALTEAKVRQLVKDQQNNVISSDTIQYLLSSNELNKVIDMAQEGRIELQQLLPLVTKDELDYKLRLGISAVFEELEGDDKLNTIVDDLGQLASHDNARVRSDIAHFLSLTHSDQATPYLQQLAKDENKEVREIAEDALD